MIRPSPTSRDMMSGTYLCKLIRHFRSKKASREKSVCFIRKRHAIRRAVKCWNMPGISDPAISPDVLEEAAKEVEKLLYADAQYAELSGKLQVKSNST